MRYIFLLCLSLAVCGTTLHAQRKQLSRAAVDSLRALKNTDNAVSALQFAIDKIDMGAMFETDSAKELKFFFKNISDDVVKISKVTTSCGCTAAHYNTDDIPAGAGGVITIKFNPKGRDGTVDTDAFVYLQGNPNRPSARLVIIGNVVAVDQWERYPVAMGQLRLKRKTVKLDAIETSATMRAERIACVNAGVTPISVHAKLKPAYMQIATEPSVLQPGEEGDLIISVDCGHIHSIPGDTIRQKVPIEGVTCRPSVRTLDITLYKKNKNENR